MIKNSVNIPIEVLIGNQNKDDNFFPFKRISVRNKYNFLDINNDIVSDIWFTKIDDYKVVNEDIIVVKKGSVYNILNTNKSFVFENWYYLIERISNSDKVSTYKVYDKARHFKLYIKGKGFIGKKYYKDGNWINNKIYALINEDKTVDLYNAKTNKLYDNISYNNISPTHTCSSLIIVNKGNKFNLVSENNIPLFKEWVTEKPKLGVGDCELIVFGDKKNGYYLINDDGKIINEGDKFDNIIYSEYRDNYFEPLKNNNLIIARKNTEFLLFTPDGTLVEKKNISIEDINLNEILENFIVNQIKKNKYGML